MIKQVVLEADDLQPSTYIMPFLIMLKRHIPNFKITLFTISTDMKVDEAILKHGDIPSIKITDKHKEWARIIKQYDWIELALHGYDHAQGEFMLNYKDAKKRIKMCEKFNKAVGLKTKKIFRAPFWQATDEALQAIADRGYVVCPDRNQIRPKIKGNKFIWNWSFENEIPDFEILKGHGHVRPPSPNNMVNCLENLKRLPQNAEYLFVSEYIKKHGSD